MKNSNYTTIYDVIKIIQETPYLQEWRTYQEIVTELSTKLPKTPRYALYGLCKRMRTSMKFDSVKINRQWYIKYTG